MTRQTFEQQIAPVSTEVQRLKEPIDQLIALSDSIETPEVALQTFQIIEGMKAAQTATEQYFQLESLSRLNDEVPQIHEVVSDTAEILLEEINEGHLPPKSIGLKLVWSAVHTWDNVRDETTAELCVSVLNNFRGEGQPTLVRAYMLANKKELPFEEALDEIIANAA